jgi:hypothetical protein
MVLDGYGYCIIAYSKGIFTILVNKIADSFHIDNLVQRAYNSKKGNKG